MSQETTTETPNTEKDDVEITDEELETMFGEEVDGDSDDGGAIPAGADAPETDDSQAGVGDPTGSGEGGGDDQGTGGQGGSDGSGSDAGGDAGEPGADESPASTEELQRQMEANKAWGTRLAQENAELRKKLGGAPPAKSDGQGVTDGQDSGGDADALPDDIAAYLGDDPMFEKAANAIAERIVKQRFGDFDPSAVGDVNDRLMQLEFERGVTAGSYGSDGQYVKGHSDAYSIMNSPEYQSWFDTESKLDPTLTQISDPIAAIRVLDRYKEHAAKQGAEAHDRGQSTGDLLRDQMTGAPSPGTKGGSGGGKKNNEAQSVEEAFDEELEE